jgi:hypothetical protein
MSRIISVSTAPYDGYEVPATLDSLASCEVTHVKPAFIAGYTEPVEESAFNEGEAERYAAWLRQSGLACFAFSSHNRAVAGPAELRRGKYGLIDRARLTRRRTRWSPCRRVRTLTSKTSRSARKGISLCRRGKVRSVVPRSCERCETARILTWRSSFRSGCTAIGLHNPSVRRWSNRAATRPPNRRLTLPVHSGR